MRTRVPPGTCGGYPKRLRLCALEYLPARAAATHECVTVSLWNHGRTVKHPKDPDVGWDRRPSKGVLFRRTPPPTDRPQTTVLVATPRRTLQGPEFVHGRVPVTSPVTRTSGHLQPTLFGDQGRLCPQKTSTTRVRGPFPMSSLPGARGARQGPCRSIRIGKYNDGTKGLLSAGGIPVPRRSVPLLEVFMNPKT